MPIQAPQWTDYLNCPVCCREFGAPPRSPISLGCGHTLCRHCLKHLHRKQCPFDQTVIQVEPEELVVNTALLQLAGYSPPAQPYHPPSIQALPEHDKQSYDCIVRCMEYLAVYLKYCGNVNNSVTGSRLSRPMQRKLVMLLQCAITDEEGRGRAARAARSLGERTVTELILQHQNPQQLSANLWAAVRARGCQFLGPAMQEEVLKLVLLALEDGSALSRKVLVMFVVQRLEPHFPQASKTSIGHVVQLLYRASCFKVSKRECDSSLMQLKEEFRTYETLRREHDAQIVQIATEAGLRIAPDQWSALLYGDTAHKSHMQSIIDKLQTPQSFAQSVQELFIALQRTGDPAQLVVMSMHLDRLANIDASPDAKSPSWLQLGDVMTSLKEVVAGFIHYLQQQAQGRDANHNQKHSLPDRCMENNANQGSPQTASTPTHAKYKVLMCRDAAARSFCPRGNACTFAHSEEELERMNDPQVPHSSSPGPRPQGSAASGPMPPFIHFPPPPIFNVPRNMPRVMGEAQTSYRYREAAGYSLPFTAGSQSPSHTRRVMGRMYFPLYTSRDTEDEFCCVNMNYQPDQRPPHLAQGNVPMNNVPQRASVINTFNPTVMPPELLINHAVRTPPSYNALQLNPRMEPPWYRPPVETCNNYIFNESRVNWPRPQAEANSPCYLPRYPPPMWQYQRPAWQSQPSRDEVPSNVVYKHVNGIPNASIYDGPCRQTGSSITGPNRYNHRANVGRDDEQLEAGLQELERRINTEFKIADEQ